MDNGKPEPVAGRFALRWSLGSLAWGAALIVAAFAVLVLYDRALGGVLFLVGFSYVLEGFGQFHPLFALLFPLLALTGAVTDASRGQPGAAFVWFLGAALIFALGRVLRRGRVGPPVRRNPALETLTAELAALKARRDRGEISEAEFQAKRDAAVAAFRQPHPDGPGGPGPS